jgi:MinD superfamily P-loop ATPase
VKQAAPAADLTVLDAPPGTSCPAVEAVRDSDFVALVTEPTPFGVHDLKLAAQMVRTLGLPFGVVVNRADLGNGEVGRYCAQARIPVLSEIPDSRAVAEAYSRGDLAYDAVSGCAERFGALLHKLERAARAARGTGSRPSDRHVRRENESP